MEFLEVVAKQYTNTIAAVSALGTWAAVVVALWISHRASKPILSVYVDKSVHIPSEAQISETVDWNKCEDTISVTIQNKGNVTAYITYWSFIWQFPRLWTISAQQNPYLPNFRADGIKLEPGQSASIFLSNDLEKHRKMLVDLCEKNKLPKAFKRFIRLSVITSEGRKFRSAFGASYKKEFLS